MNKIIKEIGNYIGTGIYLLLLIPVFGAMLMLKLYEWILEDEP